MNPQDKLTQTELAAKQDSFRTGMFPCTPPCDSHGVCDNCLEAKIFDIGFAKGAKYGREEERDNRELEIKMLKIFTEAEAKVITALKTSLQTAVAALEYAEARMVQDPVKGMHPHGFIRSTRLRGVVSEALAKIRKDGVYESNRMA